VNEKKSRFLIIAGAITAAGMPFALAFPRSLLEKALAMGALLLFAAGIALAVAALRKK